MMRSAGEPTTVPAHYVGVWQRRLLVRGTGEEDMTTRVFWLQTGCWHGDIRIPADRPDFRDVRSLGECSLMQLQWLCRQGGFAGVTRVEADVCCWQRRIDFQLSEDRDLGRMRFDGDQVEEFGIDADYYERWQHLANSGGPAQALVETATPGERYLLTAGRYMMRFANRPLADADARQLRRRIATGEATRADYEAFADFEISFGRRDATGWRIDLSTLPWREGERVDDVELHPGWRVLAATHGGTTP